jgi:hypothetical protein
MPVLELQVAQLLPVVQRLRTEFGFTLVPGRDRGGLPRAAAPV